MYQLQFLDKNISKNIFYFLFLLSCLCLSFNISAQVNTFGASTAEQCITDGTLTPATFTIPISAGVGTVSANSVVVNFEGWHSDMSDMTIQLCAPDGITCAFISTQDGGGGDMGNSSGSNYNGIYSISDGASNGSFDTGNTLDITPNSYIPAESFSVFDGVAANGNWTVIFANTSGAGTLDDGCMKNVQLFLMYEIPCTDPIVVFSQISDCGGGGYQVQVDLTGTDGGNTIELTDGINTTTVAVPGTYTLPGLFGGVTHYTASETINVNATNGGSLVCSAGSDSFTTPCNGSDDFSITAPNILGNCSAGDLSVATAGTAQGFTGGCNDNQSVGGSTANNVIRDCSAEDFNNNTNWVDVWYQVDLPDGTDEMTIDLTGLNAGEIVGFSLHTGNPGSDASNAQVFSGNSDDCSFFDNSVTSQTITGLATASIAPIYIRILSIAFNDGDGCAAITNPTFEICVTAPQPNDSCNDAIDVTVNNGGTASTGNLSSAADEGNAIDCVGTSVTGTDLWYKVSYPSLAGVVDFSTEITLSGNAADQVCLLVYDNTSACGSAGSISDVDYCDAITLTGGNDVFNLNGLLTTDGFDRDVQLVAKSVSGPITISAVVAPENNSCTHFNNILPGYNTTSGINFDFTYATDSQGDGNKDLWFQYFTTTDDQYTEFIIPNVGIWDGEVSIELYEYPGTGVDCDNLTLYCDINELGEFDLEGGVSGNGVRFNLAPGDYLVRIVETTTDGTDQLTGTITATPSTEKIAANSICTGALNITNANQTGNLTEGQLACPQESLQDCDGNNINSTPFDDYYGATLWYEFTTPSVTCPQLSTSTVVSQATIGFDALATNSGAGNKQVYVQLWSDCNTVIDCGTADNATDITFTGLLENTTYFVQVINNTLSSTGNSDFTIEQVVFPEPAPCNDNVNSAFDLGNSYISGSNYDSGCTSGNAAGATANNGLNAPGSNVNNVWFEFTTVDNADEEGYVGIYLESLSSATPGGIPYGMTINVYQEVGGTGGIVQVGSGSTNTEGDAWVDLGHLNLWTDIDGDGNLDTVDEDLNNNGVLDLGEDLDADGNLDIDEREDYFIEITHSQAADVEVLYNLCLYDIPTNTIPCPSDPVSISPTAGGQCGDLANDCGLYYRIEIPAGTPSGWYIFEVLGDGVDLDIQLFGQGSDSPSGDGNPTDYDQPCNPSHALVGGTDAGPQTTLPAGCNGGSGESAVYNLIGSSSAESNYYYLEVRDANNAGPGCNLTPAQVCSIEVSGPFTTSTLAANNTTAPDGICVDCLIGNVALNTDGACVGNDATFSLDFDVTSGSGDYEIIATAANATYGIAMGDVLGTLSSAATTGTTLTISGTVTNSTVAGTITVDVRDADVINNPTCEGGTAITINIPACSTCLADNGTFDATGFTTVACDGSGTFDVSSLWTSPNATSYSQQYILVGADGIIDEVNNTGSFTISTVGTYLIYAINTEDGNEPTNLSAGNTLADLNDGCFDLDELTESVAVTVNSALTVTPMNGSESCAADDSYSYDFTVVGGSGTYTTVSSSLAGTTITDNGNGSYTVVGIPSGNTTNITVTDDLGCTNDLVTQVPTTAINCCGSFIGNFPSGN